MRCIVAVVVLCVSLAVAVRDSAATLSRTARTHSHICAVSTAGSNGSADAGVLLGARTVEPVVGADRAGVAQAFPFRSRFTGKATSIHVYIGSRNRAKGLRVALYSNTKCRPGSRLMTGSLRRLRARRWNAVAVRNATVRAGRIYWLAVLGRGGTLRFRDRRAKKCTSVTSHERRLRALPVAWTPAHRRNACVISAYVLGTKARTVRRKRRVPSNILPPTISGNVSVGSTLTTTNGVWSNAPTGYRYQWSDCNQAGRNCTAIRGATLRSYVLASGDVGDTVIVTVTAANAAGSSSATSSNTRTVFTDSYRTFYINYSAGNDHNSGTSESSPWRLAPGMVGFAGLYSPRPGDHFMFDGGVTWPNAVFPLAVVAGGLSGNNDYYGVNPTWYVGSSLSRPIFNASSQNITGADRNSPGLQDVFMDLRRHDYITIDDIAFENFMASSLTIGFGSCAVIEMSGDQNITINRISIPNMATDASRSSCYGVEAATGSPYAGNSIVENSYISGALNSDAAGILCVGNVENNTVDRMIGEVYLCGHGTISGNLLENCGTPFPAGSQGVHADAIQSDSADGAYYIHDNVIRDTGADQAAGNECESMFVGNSGETDYVYNNVLYNLGGNGIDVEEGQQPSSSFIWNNTIVGGFNGSTWCVKNGHPGTDPILAIRNNLCITTTTALGPNLTATTLTEDHNVTLTPQQAGADGYGSSSSSFPYQPPGSSSVPTAGAGADLSSDCSGNLTGLCVTTNFAGQLGPRRRPSSGAWNAGAY